MLQSILVYLDIATENAFWRNEPKSRSSHQREIDARARAVSKGPIHSRLVGRVLGLRLGMPTWEAQRIAKSWKKHRRRVRRSPLW